MSRAKKILLMGLGILILLLVVQIAIRPMMQRFSNETRLVEAKQGTLAQLQDMSGEIAALRAKSVAIGDLIADQPRPGRMMTFLEEAGKICDLSKHITSIRPQTMPQGEDYEENRIEIQIERIGLAPLLKLLEQIEQLNLVIGVTSLDMTCQSDNLFNATLTVATIFPKR